MKKIFSGRLYKEYMHQTMGIGIVMLFLSLAFSGLTPFVSLMNSKNMSVTAVDFVNINDFAGAYIYVALLLPFALILKLFSYLFKRSSSDFYHALPYTRQCLFITGFISAFTWYAACTFIAVMTPALLYGINDKTRYSAEFIPLNFIVYMVIILYVTGAVLIAASVVGKKSIAGYFALFITFMPRAIMLMILSTIQEITEIVDMYNVFWFSIKYNLIFELLIGRYPDYENYSVAFTCVPGILATLIGAIFLMVLGFVFFMRRKSETAENAVPNNKAQMVLQSLLTFAMFLSAVATYITYENETDMVVGLIVMGIIAYIVYSAVTFRKVKPVIKTLPGILVILVISILFGLGITSVSGKILDNPIPVESIKSISVKSSNGENYYYYTPTYNDLLVRELEFDEDEIKNIIAIAYSDTCDKVKQGDYMFNTWNGDYVKESMIIETTGGGTFHRYIYLTGEDDEKLRNILKKQDEYYEAYIAVPEECEMFTLRKTENNEKLLECFLEEFEELTDREKERVIYDEYVEDDTYYAVDEERNSEYSRIVCVKGYYNKREFNNNYEISSMPKTRELYDELCYEESLEVFNNFFDVDFSEDEWRYISFYGTIEGEDESIIDLALDLQVGDGELYYAWIDYQLVSEEKYYSGTMNEEQCDKVMELISDMIEADHVVYSSKPTVKVNVNINNYDSDYRDGSLVLNYDNDNATELIKYITEISKDFEVINDVYY